MRILSRLVGFWDTLFRKGLQSQLYAIHPRDPIAYAAAIGLILLGAALACWIPVRRAMAVSPMDALLFE